MSDANGMELKTTVDALTQALIVWDDENYRHCKRTSEYAAALAREMGVGGEAAEHIRLGALLHDIGKIGVDLSVLRKPATLDADEQKHVRAHPAMGESILERVLPQPIVECAAAHHEQPDGEGYPRGLTEDQIPLGALICRVADVLDSLTAAQPYRPALPFDEAIAELRTGAGTRYATSVVEALLRMVERRSIVLAA
ncbi:MAG: HD domain-containing phosphohydrolase [Dehalococcoidia bacterium]